MYAGVRLNVEQSQVQPSDYINQIVDQVQTHLPNTNGQHKFQGQLELMYFK